MAIRRLAVGTLALLLFLAAARPAAALGTLDQSQTVREDVDGGGSACCPRPVGQTFTAGLSGLLDTVNLYLHLGSRTAPSEIQIQTVVDELPSGVVLASQAPVITFGTGEALIQATFSAPAAVTAGTQYAIVAVPPEPEILVLWASSTDLYAGGTSVFTDNDGVTWLEPRNWDLAFETYVTVAPTPTPMPTLPPTPTLEASPAPVTPIPSPRAGELPDTAARGETAGLIVTLGLLSLASSALLVRQWKGRRRVSNR